MKLLDSLIISVKALMANKLRSALTMLGIIIGVGAVITLMSVGGGIESQLTSMFEEFGANTLYVMSQTPGVKGMASMQAATPSLTLSDAEAIEERVPYVVRVSAVSENYVEVSYGDESTFGVVEGTDANFALIYNYDLTSGRFISDSDVATRAMVVVLGSEIAEDIFGNRDAVGEKIKLSGRSFTVIGTLEGKGGSFMGMSMDQMVAVPITAYQSRLFPRQSVRGEDAIQSLTVEMERTEAAPIVTAEIKELLTRRHNIKEEDQEDFQIISNEQMMSEFQMIFGAITIFMGAVASISLLVGGIGIMNIMLVSVTERTREIGIRKAVGAKKRDILLQFLIEASILSFIGGGIGIIGGSALAWVISLYGAEYGLGAELTPFVILLAVSVSVIIGILSGLFPAIRAARLNPIDALHYG